MTLGHPYVDLRRFPTRVCHSGTALWRIVGVDHAAAPWWFSTSGTNRFDLNEHSGDGTCYLASSLLGCLIETIWRDAVPTLDPHRHPPIAPSEVASLRAVRVEVPHDHICADVRGDSAGQLNTSFGITDAIGTCDSYLRPQEWAGAWNARGLDGVAYRLAHGTGLHGWAFFGPAGSSDRRGSAAHLLDDDLLESEGLLVEPPPAIADLDVIEGEADAAAALKTKMFPPPRLDDSGG